jgi:hypothetical protein
MRRIVELSGAVTVCCWACLVLGIRAGGPKLKESMIRWNFRWVPLLT